MLVNSRWTAGRVFLLLARLGLAVTFILAAYGKLRPQTAIPYSLNSLKITPASLGLSMTFFAMQVDSYQILPAWAVTPFAHTLPWLELAVGILLLTGFALRYVAIVATLLIAVFYAAVIRSYALHLAINCGCFGPNEKLTAWTLVRDGLFFAVSIALTVGAFLIHRRSTAVSSSAVPQMESSAQ